MNCMKKFLEKLRLFVVSVVGNVFDLFRLNSEVAVKITSILKKYVEDPASDLIVSIIPGDIDNIILAKLKKVLPVVLEKVSLAHGILLSSETDSDVVSAVIDHLKSISPELRAAFWVSFSGELNVALSDGKLSFAEAVALAQLVYINSKK